MKAKAVTVVSLALIALAGCGHDNPPPKVDTVPTATPPTVTSAKPVQQKDPEVNLSKEIMDVCNITVPDRQPKFDFDSSNLSSSEKEILDQVAKCLTSGPLKGRTVQLVGRADPRGEQEYNMELGENRAHSVKRYLGGQGVDEKRMTLTSRGALDATGTDEPGWQKDRRVDIALR
jgi:peptidoglycan-associated lipoprotein